MTEIRVACVQNTATRDIKTNIEWVCARIDDAVAGGAQFVALPETVGLIEPVNAQIPASTYRESDDIGLAAFRDRARQHGVMILVGSQLIRDGESIFNRCFVLDSAGEIRARYDKLHMFDIELQNGEVYRESDAIMHGDRAVLVETPLGRLGLSICYDLRFGALYRALAHAGAEMITIPAAFTQTTGKAHWHTLVRARAIETGAFVIAPNQCGHHCDKRYSYGHSLIVDPWGEVLVDGGPEPGVVYADIDLAQVEKVRARIPALKNERPFTVEQQ
ncbi:MAG: carbon-nitrogen hydrolase family protein [Gammaproteobacteria bacterium]|nr:carbon-nitrogen hydrolase family protein [Gammaproteobacteria bacterium]MDH3446622.1 carbon-nitrogen hydrolase family protein [Gammaproteobacteria bacterium]